MICGIDRFCSPAITLQADKFGFIPHWDDVMGRLK